MSFKSQSCTRVDFSGGTLDLWPLYALIPKSQTINASINCYTSVVFDPSSSLEVELKSPDFTESFSFKTYEDFMASDDGRLSLLQESSRLFKDSKDFIGKWSIVSESPAGSGLGGSSSILISILKVIFEVQAKSIDDEANIIQIARDIESAVLKTPAGIQDYFSPLKKGINCISYEAEGFKRETLKEVGPYWKERILILDSQIKHHSGFNNWQILKSFIEEDEKVQKSMRKIADVSLKTKSAIETCDANALASCFDEELEARREVSSEYVTSDLSDYLARLSQINGVISTKVCGAGGGGCLMVLFDPVEKKELLENLNSEGFKVLPFELDL